MLAECYAGIVNCSTIELPLNNVKRVNEISSDFPKIGSCQHGTQKRVGEDEDHCPHRQWMSLQSASQGSEDEKEVLMVSGAKA